MGANYFPSRNCSNSDHTPTVIGFLLLSVVFAVAVDDDDVNDDDDNGGDWRCLMGMREDI